MSRAFFIGYCIGTVLGYIIFFGALFILIKGIIFIVRSFSKNKISNQTNQPISIKSTFANKVVNGQGVYKADLILEGVTLPQRTFFPLEWPKEKTRNAIDEAYREYKSRGRPSIRRCDGRYVIKGFSNEGMEIEMLIAADETITMAYPKWRV